MANFFKDLLDNLNETNQNQKHAEVLKSIVNADLKTLKNIYNSGYDFNSLYVDHDYFSVFKGHPFNIDRKVTNLHTFKNTSFTSYKLEEKYKRYYRNPLSLSYLIMKNTDNYQNLEKRQDIFNFLLNEVKVSPFCNDMTKGKDNTISKNKKMPFSEQDYYSISTIELAVIFEDINLIKQIFNQNNNLRHINDVNLYNQQNLLFYINQCSKKSKEIFYFLEEKGINLSQRNKEGNYFFYPDRTYNNIDEERLNLMHFYIWDVRLHTKVPEFGKILASDFGFAKAYLEHTCIIKGFLDIDMEDSDGAIPLFQAAKNINTDESSDPLKNKMFKEMLSYYDYDINYKDKKGRTILHYLAQKNCYNNLVMFLRHPGIELHALDNEGNTFMHSALPSKGYSSYDLERLVPLGMLYNIDLKSVNKEGKSVFNAVSENIKLMIIENERRILNNIISYSHDMESPAIAKNKRL